MIMMMLVISLVLVHLITLTTTVTSKTTPAEGRRTIHFGAFISNIRKDEECDKAAIDAAVQLINEDDTILNGFELKMTYLDNYGLSGFGIQKFFKIQEMKHMIQILLGPFTEKFAEPIGELSRQIKLPMFEDNGETYESQQKAILAILKKFNWKRVSMLYDSGYLRFVRNAKLLKKEMDEHSIQATIQDYSSKPYFNVKEQLSKIKREDGRITILNMEQHAASTVFCDVYLQNMSFPRNIFVAGNILDMSDGWHEKRTYARDNRRCTPEQIREAAEGMVLLKRSPFKMNNRPHRAKKSRHEIWRLIKSYKLKTWLSSVKQSLTEKSGGFKEWKKVKYEKSSARVFDMVYRTALALDGLLKKYGPEKVLMTQYYDTQKYEQIMNAIKEVEFEGVSGKQRHMDVGNELDHVIYQYRNGSFVRIGYYTPSSDEIRFVKGRRLFPGPIPLDGVMLREVVLTFRPSILYAMWIAAGAGILLSFFLLYLNWHYRNKRVIKMSSPKVNNIIIVGCMSCYTSIILYGIDSRFVEDGNGSILCNATICSLSIGFTLSFGGLFSKTWRVYRIFAAARTNRKVAVRDVQLYLMIFVLVLIDVCILSSFIANNHPFQMKTTTVSEKLYHSEDVLEVRTHRQCDCDNYMSFLMTLIAYKIVLLTFGLFMAWETRNVHIPVLNDSKHIGIAVYVVALVSTVGVISSTALSSTSHVEENYLVVGLSISLCTTVTLMLVFFTKVSLIFDKTGRDRTHSTSSIISSSSSYHDPMLSRSPLVSGDNRSIPSANRNRLSSIDRMEENNRQYEASLLSSSPTTSLCTGPCDV